ncbi:matrilin-2-like [Saccostrea echinata]|uniref:matrilin-2-like n=1 Tax=Saccostrea echinata TaxID=191078 RepID=UPI002A7FC0F9|nr:matrilin-2-like [Saccostrea echinata]
MLDFVKKFLQAANIDRGEFRVGIATYSTWARIEFNSKDYTNKNDLFKAVDNISWQYGSTNTADALLIMHDTMFTAINGDRADVPNICIVITDGVSNINYGRTIPEAEAARKKGIHIYAVGIGLQDLNEVNGIANKPSSENAFSVNNFDELEGLNETIFEAACTADEDKVTTRSRPKPTIPIKPTNTTTLAATVSTKLATTTLPPPSISTKLTTTAIMLPPGISTKTTTTLLPLTIIQEKLLRETGTALVAVGSTFLVLSAVVIGVAVFLFYKTVKQHM